MAASVDLTRPPAAQRAAKTAGGRQQNVGVAFSKVDATKAVQLSSWEALGGLMQHRCDKQAAQGGGTSHVTTKVGDNVVIAAMATTEKGAAPSHLISLTISEAKRALFASAHVTECPKGAFMQIWRAGPSFQACDRQLPSLSRLSVPRTLSRPSLADSFGVAEGI